MLLWCGTASSACGVLSLLRLLLCSADFCVVDCSRKFSAFFSVKTSVSLWCLYCSASVVVATFCDCDCSLFSVGQDLPEFFVFCLLCPIPAGFRLGILLCVLRGLCCSEQVLRVFVVLLVCTSVSGTARLFFLYLADHLSFPSSGLPHSFW